VEILLREAGEPLHAMRLVRPQLREKFFAERGPQRRRAREGVDRFHFDPTKSLCRQRAGKKRRERFPDANLARLLVDFAIGEDFFHFAPRLGRDEKDALVRGARVRLTGLEPALDFGLVERDGLAIDGKFQVEAEPVVAAIPSRQRELGLRDVDVRHGVLEARAVGDGPRAAPARERVGEKARDVVFGDEAEGGGVGADEGKAGGADLGEGTSLGEDVAAEEDRVSRGGRGEIFGVSLRLSFAREGKSLRAVVGDEFESEAGEGAFESGLEGGLRNFEAELLEAGSEDDLAGALEREQFAGEEIGDFILGDEALRCGKVGGQRSCFGEVGAVESPVGEKLFSR
jgi:hypothetical protein